MKVVMYPAVTFDGFLSGLNGECYSWISDEDEAGYTEAIKKAGCVLLGRKTYDQYIDDFPPKDADFVTFVYTSRTDQPDQEKVKFLRGTPQEIINQIEAHGFTEVVVGGGGEMNGALAEAGLVDEIVASIYSLTLGEGIPLFGSRKPKLKLELLSTSQDVEGIVKNHYRVLPLKNEQG